MIKIENLELELGGRKIIDGIDLTVAKGEVIGLIGASGSGKSALLRCIVGLNKPKRGTIVLDEGTGTGTDGDNEEGKIGMVFQEFNLFDHLSVVENVMCGQVDVLKKDKRTAYDEAMKLIRRVGLADSAFLYPKALSGGQKQRAAIARTLSTDPQVILMDEPTSALDPLSRGEVETVIRMLADEGRTMMIVSHELEFIRKTCTRLIFFSDGKICEDGTPEKLLTDPDKVQTKRFVRALRVLELETSSEDFDFIGLQTTLTEYAFVNGISSDHVFRLSSILEELFRMVVVGMNSQNTISVTLEYNSQEHTIEGEAVFNGKPFDPNDPEYFLSFPIIQKRVDSLSYGPYDDPARPSFHNRITFTLK